MASRHWAWLLPLLALVIFAPYSTDLDLAVSSHYFYDGHFNSSKFNVFLYNWGEYPAFVVGGLSILIWALSILRPSLRSWRPAAAAIALAFVVGPGMLINGAFKELWGRPRPVQIQQFGGKAEYLPFYQPEFANHGYGYKSFPSGHASMGFFFFVVALVGRRENRTLVFWLGLILGIVFGILLSETRIAQGGHFLSDTVASAFITWWISLLACRVVYGPAESSSPYAT